MKKMSLFAILFLMACTGFEPELENPTSAQDGRLVDIESVSMTAHNFELEGNRTKTSITVDDVQGAVFSWTAEDVVGVFPNIDEASQVKFPIADADIEGGTSTTNANFTGNGWAVMKAQKYMAYYPFVSDMDLEKTAVPVDYRGQTQNGKGSSSHLSTYDHMSAKPTAPSSNGNIAFDFQHMSALLQLNLTVPKAAEYNSIILSCDDAEFVVAGSIDLTSETPAITGSKSSHEFVVSLENFETNSANENVSIYVMIPPVDMSGKTIDILLKGPHAECVSSFTRGTNKPFVAGKAYRPTIGQMTGGEITKLEDGDKFNADIKTLANGQPYTCDQADNMIKNIVFVAGSDDHEEGDVVVSSSTSESNIYAHWDPSTYTMTITSPSLSVFAGESAYKLFYNLTALTSINFSNFSTKYTDNFMSMFENCSAIQSLDISDIDISNTTGLRSMFSGCSSLETLTGLNNWDTSKIDDFCDTFNGCKNLVTLDLTGWSVENAHNVIDMFAGCSSLTSITRDEWNLANCSNFSNMFEGCESMTSIDVSDFNTQSAESFEYMFMGCKKITSLNLSTFETSKCENFHSMFAGCSLLENINVSGFVVNNATNFGGMFNDCNALTSIDISNFSSGKCEKFDQMFRNCVNLTEIVGLYSLDTRNALTFENMFSGCCSLTSLDVSGFVTNNVTNFYGMFEGCKNITALDVTHFNTAKATTMESMFNGCTSLTSLDVSGFNTSKVVNFLGMFGRCSGLSELDLSSFDTSVGTSFNGMFDGCSMSLIDISSFSFAKATDMYGMFCGNSNLISIVWPEVVNTSMVEYMGRMFEGCSSITSLDLSKFNTKNVGSFTNMFEGCSKLESLDISSFNTKVSLNPGKEGQEGMFEGCIALSTLKLGEDFQTQATAKGSIGNYPISIYCPTLVKNHLIDTWGDSVNITWVTE